MFMNDWKETEQRLKLHERLLHEQSIKEIMYNSGETFTEIAQSFGFTAEFITKYFSERFLSIHGRENISKGFLKFCKLS